MKIVTAAQMRAIEKLSDENGVSYMQLMRNAGTIFGRWIEKLMEEHKCRNAVFLCGSGNNGGDCFIAAEYLKNEGVHACIGLMSGMPKTEISKTAFDEMNGVEVYAGYDEIKNAVMAADVIIDGIFGTGFHGELDEKIISMLKINSEALRIAADIPSGGNAVTGAVSKGCFKADYTVTFGFKKFGMTQYPLKDYCGNIITAEIGIPEKCTECIPAVEELSDMYIPALLRRRTADSHKGTYGTLLSVTGSRSMPGAASLSGKAALRCGCGLLRQCSVPENIPSAASAFPEAVYIPMESGSDGFYTFTNAEKLISLSESVSAVLIGCGLGVSSQTKMLVRELIRSVKCPVILDADGINCIADEPNIINEAKNGIILTPHPAEMGRLTGVSAGEIQADRLGVCMEFVSMFPNAVLVLKGAGTIIASQNSIYVNSTGNPGMSTGGSGDVLSGMTASFAAQGISLSASAVLGTYIHGKAGDMAALKYSMHSMLPTDIINELPEIFLGAEKLMK